MHAFVVSLNGERLCTASIGDDGVLTVSATFVRLAAHGDHGDISLSVTGLDTLANEHAVWDVPEIGPGDVVTIEVVEVDEADPPSSRFKADPPPDGFPPTPRRDG